MTGKTFEVYQLRADDEYLCFYIGKTYSGSPRKKRHLQGRGCIRNPWRTNKIKSVRSRGAEVLYEVLRTFDTEKEALDYEVLLIKKLGRRIDGSGCLTNLTLGGEGTSGWNPTETNLKNMSEAGKISIRKKNNIAPVTAYLLDGSRVGTYINKAEASRVLHVPKPEICHVVRGRERYATNLHGVKYRFISGIWLDPLEGISEKVPLGGREWVLQYSLSGEVVGRYPTAKEASVATGRSRNAITEALKGRVNSPYYCYWRYERYLTS